MAKPIGAWGIDVGQCALKALHCRLEGDQVVADAFDYVEYPKILSQPEADPDTLIKEALEQFLSRNQMKLDDRVAISVPGQSGLAKFFKPPPVDTKKIPDIVRYEARQQIPFPLDDVIWDFQKMAGGQEIEGFAIDAEVGLFAMKREQVQRHLKPFERADIALDIVQLAPISIYNFVSYDLLTDSPPEDEFDADNPPESIVILSMGTDATDLVITNGFRLWQRSIPLGGNHFTKQLTKEMKLTFAKAEHLKRNARQAEDPKAVFQAMRPIFNDVVTEVQRSIGYFQGLDRKAKIKGVVLLGNTVKLPGLQQYVAKNLGYEVIPFDKFNRLEGSTVVGAPAFSDNILAYGVCYGLCLQTLGMSRLKTSLLPREILTRRMIKAKKPWAIASVGALLMACAFNFFFTYRVLSDVKDERKGPDGTTWKVAETEVDSVKSLSSQLKTTQAEKETTLKFLEKVGNEVVGAADRRLLWLELLKSIEQALPWTENVEPGTYVDYKTLPLDKRKELYIEYIETEYFPDLATWWTQPVQERYFQLQRELGPGPESAAAGATPPAADGTAAPAAATPTDPAATPADPAAAATPAADPAAADPAAAPVEGALNIPGPTGAGWIIEMKGYHYFNADLDTGGANHVRRTLLWNLEHGKVVLPVPDPLQNKTDMVEFTMKEMGIGFPILAIDEGQARRIQVPNPDFDPSMGGVPGMPGMPGMPYGAGADSGMPGMGGPGMYGGRTGYGQSPGVTGATQETGNSADEAAKKDFTPPFFTVARYAFTVQFCWQEKRVSERMKAKEEQKKAAEEAAKAAAAATEGAAPATDATGQPATPAAPDGTTQAAPADATQAAPADATQAAPAATTPASPPDQPAAPANGTAAPANGTTPANTAGATTTTTEAPQ